MLDPKAESRDASGSRGGGKPKREAPLFLSQPPVAGTEVAELVATVLGEPDVDLPVLPRVAQRLLALCQDGDSSVSDLAQLLRHDPVLAGHLLRVANSPFFAPRTPITSLTQALSRLGLANVREIALMVAMRGSAYRAKGLEGLLEELYRRAVLSAFYAQEIARVRRLNVEEAFLAGLLHDVGEPLVMRIAVRYAEKHKLPLTPRLLGKVVRQTHGKMGARVVESWALPACYAEVALGHHEPHPEVALVQIARLADDLADYASEGATEPELFAGHPMADALNLYPDDVEALVKKGPELVCAVEAI